MLERYITAVLLVKFFLATLCLQAQPVLHIQGEYLVSLPPGRNADELIESFGAMATARPVSEMMNIWLIKSDHPDEGAFLAHLRRFPQVRFAQFNHLLEHRSTEAIIPNDPHFSKQWHLLNDGSTGGLPDADLDADEAWELSVGGVTAAGDTIVMAVIDGGVDAIHPDMASNLWRNRHEISNNGLDDDQNGFVDDVRGWNVFSSNDNISGFISTHGTPVSAVLGASSNNGTGISGVNWNSKILFVSALGTEAEILAAYDYVWKMRKRYNETAGARGAFVVAVNCSWGINYGQPSEAPLWCEAFDWLGEVGVLSVAATANLSVDIDIVGDLPTACPSAYLISVTSLNQSDQKPANAAWGATHVDIGAYGHGVFSAASGSGYGTFSGTSYAAPQVAGAVGLLYGMLCPNLITLAKSNPGSAAYWAKSILLDGYTPNASLEQHTVTGGRLNLYNTLLHYQSQCSECPAPFSLNAIVKSDTAVLLLWNKPAGVQSVNLRWKRTGQGQWTTLYEVSDSLLLSGLWSCTGYEFEMQANCQNNEPSGWSPPFVFQTSGCCEAPGVIWANQISDQTISLGWPPTSDNNTYRIRIEALNGSGGQLYEADTNSWTIGSLLPCTEYIISIQARCEDWVTEFSNPFIFKTKGCGACNELAYCMISGVSSTQEWIASVQLGAWSHHSGVAGNGYQSFTQSTIANPVLISNSVVPIAITPGFLGTATKQYYRVFIDYNQDGDFFDDAELAFDPGFAFEGVANGFIQVPALGQGGLARMRVVMRYSTPNDPAPSACGSFDFGQVEDYCVMLQNELVPSDNLLSNDPGRLKIFPVPTDDQLYIIWPDNDFGQMVDIRFWDIHGRVVLESRMSAFADSQWGIQVGSLTAGWYMVELRSGNKVFRTRLLKN